MAKLFRSRDFTGACKVAREGKPYPGPVEKCPCGNPRCQADILPLGFMEATMLQHGPTIKRVGLLGAVILVVLLLSLLLRKDPSAEKLEKLQADLTPLEQRLTEVESRPTPLVAKPEEIVKGIAARAQESAGKAGRALAAHQIDDARGILKTMESLPGQARAAITPAPPSGAENTRTSDARALVEALSDARGTAEGLVQKTIGKPTLHRTAEALDETIEGDLARAQKLLHPPGGSGHPADLKGLLAQIDDALAKTRRAVDGYVPPPKPPEQPKSPFAPEEATLKIVATADLAENLVLPMLKSRSQGETFVGEENAYYYQSKSGSQPQERILVRTGELPYRDLLNGTADLVIVDASPSAEEKSQFAASHPGNELESRACSGIVALDALILLANPNSAVKEISAAEAARTRWIGGPERSPENLIASRFNLLVERPMAAPLEAVLADPQSRGLGLWHKQSPKIRALSLAYRPAPAAQALKPTPMTIATEEYKFSFRIRATHVPEARPEALAALEYFTSPAGQEIVAQQGYVNLALHTVLTSVNSEVFPYLGTALGRKKIEAAYRMDTNFHFETNVDTLESKSLGDLEKLPAAIRSEYPGASIVVLGFTDNVGTAERNKTLSKSRAAGISRSLMEKGLNAVAAGLGDLLPVDDNDTTEGRQRNRRAEVWVVP